MQKVSMGQKTANSYLYIYLGIILKPIGAKVGCQQLYTFLEFIERICPWFPEQGTFNADMRGCIGGKIQQYYDAHGPENISVQIFSLSTLIHDSLDHCPERQKLHPN